MLFEDRQSMQRDLCHTPKISRRFAAQNCLNNGYNFCIIDQLSNFQKKTNVQIFKPQRPSPNPKNFSIALIF